MTQFRILNSYGATDIDLCQRVPARRNGLLVVSWHRTGEPS